MITYSIVQKSQLEGALRLDSEYYQPEYLELVEKIKKSPYKRLGDFCLKITDGSHQTPEYQESGIPFLMVKDILEQQINFEDTSFISGDMDEKLKHCKPVAGDILLTKVGSVGISAVVPDDAPNFNIFVSVAVLKNCREINNYFLSTFLNSKYGRLQAVRSAKGISQPDLHLEDIKEFLIPLFPVNQQQQISKLVIEAMNLLKNSKSLYSQAEDLLLGELELKNFEVEDDLSYIVNLSEIKSAHRADAEYFQPKYKKVEKILSKFKQEKLENLSSLISYGTVPTSPYVEGGGIPYVKGENLQDCFIDYSKLVYLEKESTKLLPKKFYLKEDDIVISQMGTVGRAGLTTKQEEGWLFASFTIRIRLKEEMKSILDPLFVTLYIQNISRPYYLLRRIAQASVRQNTDLPTIRDLIIPILPKPTQQKIADLVYQSHQARKKAKELLEEAKRKVEELIEIKN